MAQYEILVKNLNTNQFNINSGIALNKGVYILKVEGDNASLINKYNKKPLVELTHYASWKRYPDISFSNITELVNYLNANIVEPGVSPGEEEEANKLDTIIEKMDIIIARLDTLIAKP